MKREHLEHIIRAAANICGEPFFVIVGSQAIHGSMLNANDPVLVRSMEADLYPLHAPEKSELLNAIGELSQFHTTFGYYADGVDETTAKLPEGWIDRVIPISGPLTENPHGFRATGLCVELHDLALSKLYAGRDKDLELFKTLAHLEKLNSDVLLKRLPTIQMPEPRRRFIAEYIAAIFAETEGATNRN